MKKFLLLCLLSTASFAQGNETMKFIQYDIKPQALEKACTEKQKALTEKIDQITKTSLKEATFKTTVLALESAMTELGNSVNPLTFVKYVSTEAPLREVADKCETAVSKMLVDIFTREDLYKVIKAAADKKEKLSKVEKKLLDEYVRDFKRNGLELKPAERKLFSEKKKRIVECESEFSKALVEWDDFLPVTKEQLEGLPDSFIEHLEKTKDGKYKLTLKYPDYFPVMENAKNGEVRKKIEEKFFNRGGEKNRKLLEETLKLRLELAKMLGYKSHADFVLEKQMAKNPKTVLAFLEKLKKKLQVKGKQNLKELLEYKQKELGEVKAKTVESYEWRYIENQIKKTKYKVDMEKIKEYFPLPTVVKGMFEIYQTLLGVEFKELKSAKTWHSDVSLYEVLRKGQPVAYFYMDLFPRDGKYGHAAAFTILTGFENASGGYEKPVSAIVANFSAPTKDKPSLLKHGEVETLFHEFGHIMHQVLTKAKYSTFSGTSVLRDFVEAPSQMLESWVWEKEPLTKLSGHYTDASKKLPDDMIDLLLKVKLLDVGIFYLRQLSFALIDMEYHGTKAVDTSKTYEKISKDVMMIPIPAKTIPEAGFGHLMGGYDAGYYGYLWSEVYAADLFTRFEKEGLLNPKTGGDYVKWILESGGERDPMELIKGFLGRNPNEKAFLKSIGL